MAVASHPTRSGTSMPWSGGLRRPSSRSRTSARDRKSTRLNSGHDQISYAVFCLKKKKHTSELQSRSDLVCRLLLEKQNPHTLSLYTTHDSTSRVCRHLSRGSQQISNSHTYATWS